MSEDKQNIPIDNNGDDEEFVDNFIEDEEAEQNVEAVAEDNDDPGQATPVDLQSEINAEIKEVREKQNEQVKEDRDRMGERLERLGGEPAPVITPEEFARLQKSGQVNIDSRGRVRTARREDAEAGVSLRKRRAWYDENSH